jgi:hypothetical protein
LCLDPGLLLGPVVTDQRRRHVTFLFGEHQVSVRRAVLSRARMALRPMPGVTATLDSAGLHLRWRGGRGGLDLFPQTLTPAERRESLHVVFSAPVQTMPEKAANGHGDASLPAPIPSPPSAPARVPQRPSGAWLADVLAELGFGL